MTAIAITAIICATILATARYWFADTAASESCACGHPAAFHKDGGGCRHTHDGSTDCYGYCTCTRRFADVARDQEVS